MLARTSTVDAFVGANTKMFDNVLCSTTSDDSAFRSMLVLQFKVTKSASATRANELNQTHVGGALNVELLIVKATAAAMYILWCEEA